MFNIEAEAQAQEKRFEGEWMKCRRTGAEVLMVPMAHPEFERRVRALEREYRAKNGLLGRNIEKPIPDEERSKLWAKAVAQVLLRDWRYVGNNAGAQAYSADLAFVLLTDAKFHRFRQDVGDLVVAMADEEREEVEAIEKNS